MKWPEDYDSAGVTFTCRRGATPCNVVDALFPKRRSASSTTKSSRSRKC